MRRNHVVERTRRELNLILDFRVVIQVWCVRFPTSHEINGSYT
jgi:hypothetical protein